MQWPGFHAWYEYYNFMFDKFSTLLIIMRNLESAVWWIFWLSPKINYVFIKMIWSWYFSFTLILCNIVDEPDTLLVLSASSNITSVKILSAQQAYFAICKNIQFGKLKKCLLIQKFTLHTNYRYVNNTKNLATHDKSKTKRYNTVFCKNFHIKRFLLEKWNAIVICNTSYTQILRNVSNKL